LAELLPNHTLPELLFLETKWASLMSYGMTLKLLQDVLPIDEPVNTFIIRQHVADVAERLEQEMGDEQFCFVRGLPAELGRTSCSRWSAYHWDRWWLCPRAAQARTFRGDCRQEHLGF
jgi:hypothetical protein